MMADETDMETAAESPAGTEDPWRDGQAGEWSAGPDPETFNLVMPEDSGYGEAEKTEFVAMARELGLTEKQTQRIVEKSARARSAGLEAQRAARDRQVEEWNRALREDRDFGGAGFTANVQYFLAGVKHVDPDGSLTQLLEDTGYGSHPAVVKALAKIGRQLDSDRLIGRGVAADDRQLAERYFNN
ncbi:MAG: hypothetical protein LUG19_07785 [Desulfovibrio sp.]|uniref:hypothetical protein n=1 Tax=Desulfovibrio sp. TaxID=885 RepID=UPI00258F40CD|nr:hypothetical protein [Desulfovibrio sp.]MCD7984138.1 hypothetical protein [Desulfovibrio sp.]